MGRLYGLGVWPIHRGGVKCGCWGEGEDGWGVRPARKMSLRSDQATAISCRTNPPTEKVLPSGLCCPASESTGGSGEEPTSQGGRETT